MKTLINRIVFVAIMACCSVWVSAESVILYSENGQGGIRQTRAEVTVADGQYVVKFPKPSYGSTRTTTVQIPVQRVKDSASIMYRQKKWAEKYPYAIEVNGGWGSSDIYYFNMQSRWFPAPTYDPNDPYKMTPIKKLRVYRDGDRGPEPVDVVLIDYQGSLYLYFGDDYFVGDVENNARPLDFAPSWSRQYKYRGRISGGWTVYFNL